VISEFSDHGMESGQAMFSTVFLNSSSARCLARLFVVFDFGRRIASRSLLEPLFENDSNRSSERIGASRRSRKRALSKTVG